MADHVPSFFRYPQKNRISPVVNPIKSVKGVSFVDQLSSVQAVTNVPFVAKNLPVLARLHQF